MASLPSNTFLFNYNAREMISEHSYYIIPQNVQQLYNEFIYLDGSGVTAHTEEGWAHINYAINDDWPSEELNPFNRDSNNSSFTFIYKTANFNSGNTTLFAGGNYRVKPTAFQTADSDFLSLTPNSNPQICLIRVYSDGRSERKFLDTGGNVLQSTSSSTINWGEAGERICFFGTDYSSEIFDEDFYWMYCSTETLTDAEVLQVIRYNENEPVPFGPDDDSFSATYTGLTTSTTLNAEDLTWSATTIPSWVTVSPSTGSGTTQLTIKVAQNNSFSARTGSIVFTSSESNTAETVITQTRHPALIPKNNIYREGNLIN